MVRLLQIWGTPLAMASGVFMIISLLLCLAYHPPRSTRGINGLRLVTPLGNLEVAIEPAIANHPGYYRLGMLHPSDHYGTGNWGVSRLSSRQAYHLSGSEELLKAPFPVLLKSMNGRQLCFRFLPAIFYFGLAAVLFGGIRRHAKREPR